MASEKILQRLSRIRHSVTLLSLVDYVPISLLLFWMVVSFYAFGEYFCYIVLSREGGNLELRTHKLLLGFQLTALLYGIPAMEILFPSNRKSRAIGPNKRLFFCRWCHDITDGKTVHCFACATCIPRHFTHSTLFNKCIGQHNVVPFLQFLLFFSLNQGFAFRAVLKDFDKVDVSHLSHAIVAYYLALTFMALFMTTFYFMITVFHLAFNIKPGEATSCRQALARERPGHNLREWLGPSGLLTLLVPAIPSLKRCATWSRIPSSLAWYCPKLTRSHTRYF